MTHPYSALPDRNFWKKAVSPFAWTDVFSHENGRFKISPSNKIATAGSCFAQRISRVLVDSNFNFYETEAPHPLIDQNLAKKLGYGRFSARYGNIYTPRQLRQLIDEAYGIRPQINKYSKSIKGTYIDLMRPNINELGFSSELEAEADRCYHLKCVKKIFETSDLFIFTFGLTEAWSSLDGEVVYGSHPSVVTGYDYEEVLAPINFDYIACFNDMVYVINFISNINPDLKFIFTVSPVALAATHQNNHVLMATTYSKSVLRAVAGKLVELWPKADYFHSYEIFSAAQSFGQFLSSDLRDVNDRGVCVAMNCFKETYFDTEFSEAKSQVNPAGISKPTDLDISQSPAQIECDEQLNALFEIPPTP